MLSGVVLVSFAQTFVHQPSKFSHFLFESCITILKSWLDPTSRHVLSFFCCNFELYLSNILFATITIYMVDSMELVWESILDVTCLQSVYNICLISKCDKQYVGETYYFNFLKKISMIQMTIHDEELEPGP